VSDINRKIAYMLEKINQYIHHSYLKKFIASPKVDEDKLFLLVAMCSDLELDKDTIESYIITTMLVQVALDTHEEVSVSTRLQDLEQKEQQLMVLAGDYYSGLYYSLLAEIEDIKMVQTLATSIKHINEHKIRVYRQDSSYQNSIIESLKIIESELFRNIADSFHLSIWQEMIPEILLLKRLYKEKAQFVETGSSFVFKYLVDEESKLLNKTNRDFERRVLTNFDLTIMKTRERIQTILTNKEIHSSILSSLQLMVNSFEHPMHQIVEEG
jgi:heptaprenyl diphosphate synthase